MTLNRDYSLNIKLWASVVGLGLFGSAAGVGTALNTLERVERARSNAIAESSAVAQTQRQARLRDAQIVSKADTQQSYIDNHVNTFNSLTLDWYVCDPNNPPSQDWARLAQPHKVQVVDRNQRVVGELMPSGVFFPILENCK